MSTATNNAPDIEEVVWLRNTYKIKEWLESVSHRDENASLDYWKLQLRIRFLASDLHEAHFKDPITFSYYYEQIKNDFVMYVAPTVTSIDSLLLLINLGCLEMRFVPSYLTSFVKIYNLSI